MAQHLQYTDQRHYLGTMITSAHDSTDLYERCILNGASAQPDRKQRLSHESWHDRDAHPDLYSVADLAKSRCSNINESRGGEPLDVCEGPGTHP